MFRHFRHLSPLIIAIVLVTNGAVRAQPALDCDRRDPAVIAAREHTAAEWPNAVMAQIELAVCYDKAWRFKDVEPAIAKASANVDAEIAAAPPAASSPGARPIAGSDVPEPRRTSAAQADYPPKALIAGITGSVIAELVIDPKGSVREARVVKSVPELDDAALKAVRKWKYEPTVIDGKATEVTAFAMIRFGQTTELIPSDQLAMAAFYYERGLLKLTRGALAAANTKAAEDRIRFDGYVSGRSAGPGSGVTSPVKTKDVRPGYPASALSAGVQGTVIIEALLDTSGKMGRARILSKPSVLDAAALNAVLQWEFQPASRNGQPIAISITTTVSFSVRR